MHLADSIVLPAELEAARAAGTLVIFAGAGVSMGAPACLPSFEGLARRIAEAAVPWRDEYRRDLDRYLGRARRAGVDVQERARMFLRGGGAHTELHEHLLGLFGAPEGVRLITTNFDRHFTTAAEAVFPSARIPHFVGPALPLGRGFHGIAHLHGALDHSTKELVLTASDFASAYMADGWATRFLVPVFSDTTVLFVGYSISDPLMQYLLEAIRTTGRWYALWHEDEIGKDSEHAIIPVPFRTAADGARYGDLNEGIRRWRAYAERSPADHERELRHLIDLGPPASPLDADYLRARLRTEAGRITFWDASKDESWFAWASAEGLLDGLTDSRNTDQLTALWGRWVLSNYSNGANPPLLRFLRGRPLPLQPLFAAEIVRYLCASAVLTEVAARRQLIALVLQQRAAFAGDTDLLWLLERLMREECDAEALAVLRVASEVRLQPLEQFYLWAEKAYGPERQELRSIANRVGMLAPAADLVDLFERHGQPFAARVSDTLLSLGTQRLLEAYELLELARGEGGAVDWFSLGRRTIQRTNRVLDDGAEDALVTIIRMVLDHWGAEGQDSPLRAFAEGYERSPRRLLRRLALYAYSKCRPSVADDVLRRATALGWARDEWARPEFYLLLGTHYRHASEDVRREFVRVLGENGWWAAEFDEHTAHLRFSLAQKLLREAPDSPATREFATAEVRDHPEWDEDDPEGVRARPEAGWVGAEPSPISADQMLGWSAEEAIRRIVEAVENAPPRGDDASLVGTVQKAAHANPAWAREVIGLAMNGEGVAIRVADAALWGLRDASLSAADKLAFLRLMTAEEWAQDLLQPLASVLQAWGDQLESNSDRELLDAFDAVADCVYARSANESPSVDVEGWTERALNHPAGHAAQVWWSVANARDWVGGQFVISVDVAERERWTRVLREDSAGARAARAILGMATERISNGDFPWTERVVFPAFDPSVNPDAAAQLWDGRLMQRQWSPAVVEGLRPHIEALFDASAELVPARSRELGDWVAMLAADPSRSRLTIEQLNRFVRHATVEARVAFAYAMPRHLERLGPDARRHAWRELLRAYWEDRRTNVPVPLEADELREMISWVMALPEVAPDAIAELRSSPRLKLSHGDHLIWRWKDDAAWVSDNPDAAVGIIGFLAERNSIAPWNLGPAVTVLERALDAGASRSSLRAVAELLAAVSAPGASAFMERLREDS